MHAFDILGDPVRRRILQLLADGEQSSGAIVQVIVREFGISQPAISQHLRVLRENGFASVEAQAQRRIYSIKTAPLVEIEEWLAPFRRFWDHKMDALATEIARGKKAVGQRASGEEN
jgi:DNA-binding transcriptional ArsR family regulator